MFIHAWSGINLQDNPKSMIFKKFFSIGSCNCSCCMTATSPSANLCHLGHGPTDHGQITTNHHILGPWSWRESFRAWDPDEQSYSRAYSRWHLGLHESCCKPFTKAKDSHGFPWIPMDSQDSKCAANNLLHENCSLYLSQAKRQKPHRVVVRCECSAGLGKMPGFDDPVKELPTGTKLHDEVNISAAGSDLRVKA